MKSALRCYIVLLGVLVVFLAVSLQVQKLAAPVSASSSASSGAPSDAASGAAASDGSVPAESGSTAEPTPEPTVDPAHTAAVADAVAQLADWRMILVSIASPMPDDYTVDAKVADGETQKQLQTEAADAFLAMQAAAKADGVSVRLQSGYRTVNYQKTLFENKVQRLMDTGLDEATATEEAKTVVTLPGCSEHNCGLAADINTKDYYALEEGFKDTPAFAWLSANAEGYGFILRYPKDKEDITAIIYEPWHWRYVGPENAAKINASGLCLEEYIAQLNALAAEAAADPAATT